MIYSTRLSKRELILLLEQKDRQERNTDAERERQAQDRAADLAKAKVQSTEARALVDQLLKDINLIFPGMVETIQLSGMASPITRFSGADRINKLAEYLRTQGTVEENEKLLKQWRGGK